MYDNRNDELTHYGVKGMRWGVHRARKKLSTANSSGNTADRDKAVRTLESHQKKINKKIAKLDSRSEALEKRRYEQVTKNAPKAAKLNEKAAKLNAKADRTRNADRAHKRRAKANQLKYKVAQMEAQAAKTRAKIEKNEKYKRMFEQGLKDVDVALINRGRNFLLED